MDIYSLTNQYKETVANETDSSLRSCELLYEIQSVLLGQHDNNSNLHSYKKAIVDFRKDVGVSKTHFNKRVLVGATLIRVASNEIRAMSVDAIYKQFCLPPKTPKSAKEKVNWQIKYEQLHNGYMLMLKKMEEQQTELKRLKTIIRSIE